MVDMALFRDLLEKAGINYGQSTRLAELGYFDQPASKGHHLAESGGLASHCINVTRRLLQLTETLGVKWPRPESPYLVGLLHDHVKCRCYRAAPGTEGCERPKWEYIQPVYPGHGACSAAIAAEIGVSLKRDEIVAITYHMGAYGVGKEYTAEEFDAALRRHGAQVIATCCADWYAARVDEEAD